MKFNALIPELAVKDVKASKQFYVDILGFEVEYTRAVDGFAFLSYGDAQFMLEQINGNWETGEMDYPFGRGINFQIDTGDIERLHRNLAENGWPLFRDIFESCYRENEIEHRQKELLVQDPDGYLLRFSQTI